MKKLKVVVLLAIMMCGLVGCKEDVEVHTEYAKAQPLQLHIEEAVQETVEQAKVSAEIAMEEAKKEFSPYYVAVSSLNIRQAPDTNSSLVGSLVFGDYVNAYIDGEWAELDNGTYVSAEYLTSELLYADYVQMVIDWECARLTKPDKQMNARETLDKLYPELKDKVLPVIEELGL